jgi:predicted peptidase
MARKRKKPLPELPVDFSAVQVLPIPLFALASGEHEETTRRRIKSGQLEVVEIGPKKRYVVLTPEHRALFASLVALRNAQSTSRKIAHTDPVPPETVDQPTSRRPPRPSAAS